MDAHNPSLQAVVELLGVSTQNFNDSLTSCVLEFWNEVLIKTYSVEQLQKGLETMMKLTYSALFEFLVLQINQSITSQTSISLKANPLSPSALPSSFSNAAFISIRDIFRFESFPLNSFKQLYIIYYNGALQKKFNTSSYSSSRRSTNVNALHGTLSTFLITPGTF
mmetsp:Transcript_35801/g.36011  ORF Transcript_35801/g.36011 Transcript_35801/m.36011 type:complete len:166 (-) Transcript_35801:369-866(-)